MGWWGFGAWVIASTFIGGMELGKIVEKVIGVMLSVIFIVIVLLVLGGMVLFARV